ncbi:uncharacterized protein LOC143914771 [Arctopsyche grandis]|uniref:uncharacterized protein LOC143914771 n=1 Tax=Arctopsyche grandis TaxID=121162 RepID=UPI00406D8B0F
MSGPRGRGREGGASNRLSSSSEDHNSDDDDFSDDSSLPITRAKRRRFVTESEDESDGSVIGTVPRGCRPLESDDSDNWTSSNSDNEKDDKQKLTSVSNPSSISKNDCHSDSSEGESDKCPVCLLKFSSQQIGTPDACDHIFCSDCLTEWSNHVNTCPVDRKEFAFVLVRNKIGGNVIKSIPVKPRRISLDDLVEEQPTICQICQSAESEETMLLCDACDLGFHMECLEPPLYQIPPDDWYCPGCSVAHYNEINGSREFVVTSPMHPSHSSGPHNRSSRQINSISDAGNHNAPSTSNSNTSNRSTSSRSFQIHSLSTSQRTTTRKRKITKRRRRTRRSRTVVIEYEIRNGEKFPSKTKKYTPKRRRRKKVKRTRTAARRTLVRSSVKGRLAELFKSSSSDGRDLISTLSVPQFSIFGNRNELDIVVSDDEDFGSHYGSGNGTAVAVAPRSSVSAILAAYRQNRRKTVSIPSPSYGSSAPDILSSILESQTILHSKHAQMSVKQDGSVIVQVPNNKDVKHTIPNNNEPSNNGDKVLDLRKADPNIQTKTAPAYGNSGRGGHGGWRGGRGEYQNGSNNNRSGRSYQGNSYQGGNSGNYRDSGNFNSGDFNNQGNSFHNSNSPWSNTNSRNQSRDQYSNMQDRSPHQRPGYNMNRGRGNQPRFSPQTPQRSRGVPPWQQQNYSENSEPSNESSSNMYSRDRDIGNISNAPNEVESNAGSDRRSSETVPLGVYQVSDERGQSTGEVALPQPPIIRFKKPTLSDDEKDESDLRVDDKYDPTEPTIDDSTSDDDATPTPVRSQNKITIISPPEKENLLSFDDSELALESLNVSPKASDHSAEQILIEDELTLATDTNEEKEEKAPDSDVEGECPNFSIYSSTSMDIAKNKEESLDNEMKQQIDTGIDDLVQEDDFEEGDDAEISINSNEELNKTEEAKANDTDNDADKEVLQQNDANQRQSLLLQSKYTPKKNIIKINLFSNFSNKKKSDTDYNKPSSSEKDDLSFKSDVDSTISIEKDVNNYINLEHNQNDCILISNSAQNTMESLSDIEDERSYTPCLDENKSVKSKDTSLEDNDKGSGIEGLETELISEDEGNELFSDPNNRPDRSGHIREAPHRETEPLHPGDFEEGEIVEKNKQKIKAKVKELLEKAEEKISDDDKKKKKREKRNDKDDKEKPLRSKSKRESDNLAFKKLSKSGKERNYRERDDKSRGKDRRRSKSTDKENKDKRDRMRDKKREKRKDMERYDVRNIISDKSRRMKDAFGRDKSRPRSNTPNSRNLSPSRFRRSVSRKRSLSRNRRSISRTRRSVSRKNRSISVDHLSKSPRKISPPRRPSITRRRRTLSRGLRSQSKEHKSLSPRGKRSVSPRKRLMSPKLRESVSPKKRISLSPRSRSPLIRNKRSPSVRARRSKSRNRRSISKNRSRRIRRSLSRNRRPSPRLHRNKSPRRRLPRRSRSKVRSISRNRSRSPKSKKIRKLKRNRSVSSNRKSRSPLKSKIKRKRSQSYSPGIILPRSLSRERMRHPRWQEIENSPLFQDWTSGSQSMSPSGIISPSWTPPPVEKSPEPRNLRVILTTNKDKIKKREKKKKSNKRNKITERILKQSKDLGPSKEVFTSGNNILVSVSFNKNKESDNDPAMPPPEPMPKKKKKKTEMPKQKKEKSRDKIKKRRIEKEKRCKELENKKPVAIIDLDKSPFKELTPSPKAVIVLSDSDNGEKEELMVRQEILQEESIEIGFPQPEMESVPSSPTREHDYVTSTGPKTPPEPPIKFTIISKSNPQLRAVNPLHEDEDETVENQEENPPEDTANRTCEIAYKGPNTPPEPPNSPPSSPDAYDPFEPTKSGSATPETNLPSAESEIEKIQEIRIEETLLVPCMSLEAAQKSNLSADDVIQAKPISPTEKVMALLKSTRASLSPGSAIQQIFSEPIFDTIKVDSEVTPPVNPPANLLQSPDRSTSSITINKSIQPQSTYSAVVKPNSPKLIFSTVAPTVVTSTPVYLNPVPRIAVYSMGSSPSTQKTTPVLSQKITLPSPTKSSPLKSQPPKLFLTKPSPIKSTPIKPMPSTKTLISKLPLPTIKPLPTRSQKTNKNKSGQNGSDIINLDMDIDSPYSPGSSDFGDLFEPPSDNGKHISSTPVFPQKAGSKFDNFDNLFGSIKSTSKNSKGSGNTTKVAVRQIKKSKGKTGGVKIDEDSLKILDDLPSSAVEMQVKTKFLKKLNRQERVVEEVKLVLKPHYAKKHINKDEYKDILRRAVPKICHNRSGEINPAKIQALIEAYVKKFRKKAHQSK